MHSCVCSRLKQRECVCVVVTVSQRLNTYFYHRYTDVQVCEDPTGGKLHQEVILVCGISRRRLFQLVFIPAPFSLRGLSIPPTTSNAALNPSPAPSLIPSHLADNLQRMQSDGKLPIITRIRARHNKGLLFAVVLSLERHIQADWLSLIKADIFPARGNLLRGTEKTPSASDCRTTAHKS